ncbi:hypothetical protein, partial [Pontiella sp.]|uniref:hypothetical protein n=1 Tax=Pontiella sp. TaxID=2837462 RepID=UPI00356998D7
EKTLTAKEQQLQRQIETQQQKLHKLAGDLQAETEGRKDAEMALKNLQARYADSRQDADSRILVETQNLSKQIEEYRQNENTLMQQLEAADKAVQQRDRSLAELKQEREQTAEQLKQAEQKLADIEHAHRAELNQSLAEVQEIGRRNSTLVDEVNETVRTCLSPVLKTTVIMEQADNLSTEQKRELVSANHQCRSLIDMMDYRKGLTHLADGSDAVARSQCDLHALLADIDHQFCHRAKTNKLFFAVGFAQYQTANNVPKHVATDPEKLRKTLSILLGYALDHTKKGRVGLHASRKSADSSGMVIAFEMTFTAAARNDLLADIFDSETEGVVDLKHGLTLARRYIAMLGGKAKLEHREAGVTALTIDFPFARAGAATATPAQEKGEQAAGAA